MVRHGRRSQPSCHPASARPARRALSWDGEAHPMDAWMEARLDQRTLEWPMRWRATTCERRLKSVILSWSGPQLVLRAPCARLGVCCSSVGSPWRCPRHGRSMGGCGPRRPAGLTCPGHASSASEAAQLRLDEEAHQDMLIKPAASRPWLSATDGLARTATFAISAPWRRALQRRPCATCRRSTHQGSRAALPPSGWLMRHEQNRDSGASLLPQVFKWDDEIRRTAERLTKVNLPPTQTSLQRPLNSTGSRLSWLKVRRTRQNEEAPRCLTRFVVFADFSSSEICSSYHDSNLRLEIHSAPVSWPAG